MVAVASQVGAAALHTIIMTDKYTVTFVKEITYRTTVEADCKSDALQVWGSDPYGYNEEAIAVTIGEPLVQAVSTFPNSLSNK